MTRKKAFTLIELLVVIAIIAMLLSILMPALARTRKQGKSVACRSNLRQFVIAAGVYAANNDQHYPIAYLRDPDPSDQIAITAEWDCIKIKNWNTGKNSTKPGLLWQGVNAEKVHKCPSYKESENTGDATYSGYNYNVSYIGHGSGEICPTPAKVTEVRKPAQCILFGDGRYYGGPNKYMRSPLRHPGDMFPFRAAGTQGFRHLEKTNIAWADGHVTSQSKCYTDTTTNETQKVLRYNKTAPVKVGFISADNSAYDLK